MIICVKKSSVVFLYGFLLIFFCKQSTPAEDEVSSAIVSSVRVHARNVFDLSDPAQRHFLFALANKLHITTREYFIRNQILFKQGDVLDPYLTAESERLLREFEFIRSAKIIFDESTVNGRSINVYTRDAWSTIPELSYGTKGGEETWSIGIKEKNLLGLGKTVAAYYKKDLDRTYKEFYYEDPYFIMPRWVLGLNFQHDGDKKSTRGHIARPFYSSLTPWALFAEREHSRRSIKLYADSDEIASFDRDRRHVLVGGGLSVGSTTSRISRLRVSFFKQDDDFTFEFQRFKIPPVIDKKMTGIKASFEYADLDYYKEQYVNTFDRVEDFNRGNELFVEYGYSPKGWDSDITRHLVKLTEQRGITFLGINGLFGAVSGETRVEKGKAVNLKSFYHVYHYMRLTNRQTLVTSLNFEHGHVLDTEEQILVGGASGLRGYSVRQFAGNKKLLFNMEYRSFWIHDFLRLVSIGGILFFDSGFSWSEGRSVDLKDLRSDVGFGLRIDPTRGRGASPFNISLAYALNKNQRDHRWVVTISGQPDLLNSIGRMEDTLSNAITRF